MAGCTAALPQHHFWEIHNTILGNFLGIGSGL